MPSQAKVNLIGHLAADPATKFTPQGLQITTISIPVNSRAKDGAESVDWYRVSTFSKTAEFVQNNLYKGDLVHITGTLKGNTYKANDGTTKFSLEVAADSLLALSPKRETTDQPRANATAAPQRPQRRNDLDIQMGVDPYNDDTDPLPF